jgi:sulfide dehydrogenase cytochrome subunit
MPRLLLLLTFLGFQAQAAGSPDNILALNCQSCHAALSEPEGIPSLHSLSQTVIENALLAFKRGERDATVMNRISSGLSDEEIVLIARFLGHAPE